MSTPNRNYTVNDYQQFFNDINFPVGHELRLNTKDLIYDLHPPEVELHSLYGINLKTPASFIYSKVLSHLFFNF